MSTRRANATRLARFIVRANLNPTRLLESLVKARAITPELASEAFALLPAHLQARGWRPVAAEASRWHNQTEELMNPRPEYAEPARVISVTARRRRTGDQGTNKPDSLLLFAATQYVPA